MDKALKTKVAFGLLAFWLVSAIFAFWWFQGQLIRPFSQDYSPFVALASDQASLGRTGGRVTVIELIDEDCYCSRINRPHRERIREHYGSEQVHFVAVRAGENLPDSLTPRLLDHLAETSTPAALVLGQSGRLEYFGPYSFGAGCFTGTGTYVERAIDRALTGSAQPQVNVLGSGCFCDWNMHT